MSSHPALLRLATALFVAVALSAVSRSAVAQEENKPPKGFVALFNGRDFDEWTFGQTKSLKELAELPSDKKDALKKSLKEHWKVDKGELVSDGKEPYLATP